MSPIMGCVPLKPDSGCCGKEITRQSFESYSVKRGFNAEISSDPYHRHP